ncbi:hypothetical protein [Ureibacillus terrenus]|uniref:hypothetical protein n=1 Tax=Ureibacillus terrenus TaxID=118246 RepID=UPI002E1BA5CD|nr:hypothetical protein [Ureibacillus terrenus]
MLFWIIAAEIAFWIVIISGLYSRYILKRNQLSLFFFILTPVIDFALLVLTAADLKSGAPASFAHGLAAVYIGVSIAFGKSMIAWADRKFQSRILQKPLQHRELFGRAKAVYEMKMWGRHLIAYLIGCLLLGAMILYVGIGEKTFPLLRVLSGWTLVLLIDFLISFSYVIFPKRESKTDNCPSK